MFLRHCWLGTLQSPYVSPNAMSTWSLLGLPLSQRIPKSAPEMPKRWKVLFGLAGPSTQPAIDVVGAGTAAAGAGPLEAEPGQHSDSAGCRSGPTGCPCRADWPRYHRLWSCRGAELPEPGSWGSRPSLGNGARSSASIGLRPIGRCSTGRGTGIFGAAPLAPAAGTVCAHGAAVAGGATSTGTISPTTAADAADTDAIRRSADMSYPSKSGTTRSTSATGRCDNSYLCVLCDS